MRVFLFASDWCSEKDAHPQPPFRGWMVGLKYIRPIVVFTWNSCSQFPLSPRTSLRFSYSRKIGHILAVPDIGTKQCACLGAVTTKRCITQTSQARNRKQLSARPTVGALSLHSQNTRASVASVCQGNVLQSRFVQLQSEQRVQVQPCFLHNQGTRAQATVSS